MPRGDTLTLSLDLSPRAPLLPVERPRYLFKVVRGGLGKSGWRRDVRGVCWQIEPDLLTGLRKVFKLVRVDGDHEPGGNVIGVYAVMR